MRVMRRLFSRVERVTVFPTPMSATSNVTPVKPRATEVIAVRILSYQTRSGTDDANTISGTSRRARFMARAKAIRSAVLRYTSVTAPVPNWAKSSECRSSQWTNAPGASSVVMWVVAVPLGSAGCGVHHEGGDARHDPPGPVRSAW